MYVERRENVTVDKDEDYRRPGSAEFGRFFNGKYTREGRRMGWDRRSSRTIRHVRRRRRADSMSNRYDSGLQTYITIESRRSELTPDPVSKMQERRPVQNTNSSSPGKSIVMFTQGFRRTIRVTSLNIFI